MRFLLLTLLLILPGLLAFPARSAIASGDVAVVARKLINAQGCKACHPLEGAGGNTAPELAEVGRHRSVAALRNQLVNPEHRHGNGRIPDFHHLTAAEIDALVSFLKQPAQPPAPAKPSP